MPRHISRPDAYMHAWAEVYLPTACWRGYDPSRGLLVSDGPVPVAAGFAAAFAAVTGWYAAPAVAHRIGKPRCGWRK